MKPDESGHRLGLGTIEPGAPTIDLQLEATWALE
jgi:hypothetical protein